MAAGTNHKAKTDLTEFQRFIRERRLSLKKSQAEIAHAIGVGSPEFITMVEGGKRRIDLDRVPNLARALNSDPRSLCKLALRETAPEVYRTLFGEHHLPLPEPMHLGETRTLHVTREAADFWERLSALPDELRRSIERIVKYLYAAHLARSRMSHVLKDIVEE